jgi:hypothetical protein
MERRVECSGLSGVEVHGVINEKSRNEETLPIYRLERRGEPERPMRKFLEIHSYICE